ncbi:tRNA-intron lyase [Candidatus Woesearchaeota archaeon]|nr:tRNA-intron lyase [Candidatus Woesearchaeota archaeon]
MSKKKVKETKEENIEPEPEKQINDKFIAVISGQRVISKEAEGAKLLYDQSRFGEIKDGKIQYSLVESLYLLERNKLIIKSEKNKELDFEAFVKLSVKYEPNFWKRYCVYRDLRTRGYIVKTALKFGADFRVYDRGVKPGEDHAKWIVYPVHESETLTWYEFAAKNRVAHSTRKKLMLGIVDDENDVTYYICSWMRP